MRDTATVRGYKSNSYGDGFADVYDEWYADVTDVGATVARLAELAGPGGNVLELGVGTGRLAVPMADAGLSVTGIDSSAAMLEQLASRDPNGRVASIAGDMVDDLPAGPFDAALVAYNTLFNLLAEGAQQRCFTAVAGRLRPGGRFVVEAFVPDAEQPSGSNGSDVSVRSMEVDRVVLSVSRHSPDGQQASGQFVEFTESGGVRLRPWSVRWATVQQLDAMATAAGFDVEERFGSMTGEPFTDDSTQHVTVYRLAT
jgi:SAM-dependent methyltransferase